MELNVNFNSVDKANPNYKRVITPLKDDDSLKITITPLKNLEQAKYVSQSKDDDNDVVEKILTKHVKHIDGLTINFADGKVDITKIDQLLDLPRNETVEKILMTTFNEIMNVSSINEDEEKNLD